MTIQNSGSSNSLDGEVAYHLEPSLLASESPDISTMKTISLEVYQRLVKASVDVFKQGDAIQKLNGLIADKDATIKRLQNEISTLNRNVKNMAHLSNVCNSL